MTQLKKIFSIPIILAAALAIVFSLPKAIEAYNYYSPEVKKLNSQVKGLNQEIYNTKQRIAKERRTQEIYLEELRKKQLQKATLTNQLALIDNKIKKTELDIEDLEIDINLASLEIQKTNNDIEENSKEIARREKNLSVALSSLYKESESNILEVFLLNNNLSDFLSQLKYLEDINQGIDKTLKELSEDKINLEGKIYDLEAQNQNLDKLKSDQEDKLIALAAEKENKKILLEETKASEEEYQRLVAIARQEQLKAQADITALEREVRLKLAKIERSKLKFNDSGFVWPVPPNVITATFHDKDYPYRHIFEHPAIDIRAGQRTPIRAVASGYVARARDAGLGYNYIMLVHGDGLSSVYGHVNKINVKEDQYVNQGQVIGLSGGMPGTAGAGRLTTGPHLHFEIRLNGIPVDPLGYLPR